MDEQQIRARTIDLAYSSVESDVVYDDGGAALEMIKMLFPMMGAKPKLVRVCSPQPTLRPWC